jgi:hypothetical protein
MPIIIIQKLLPSHLHSKMFDQDKPKSAMPEDDTYVSKHSQNTCKIKLLYRQKSVLIISYTN